jgi:hypothetical protein
MTKVIRARIHVLGLALAGLEPTVFGDGGKVEVLRREGRFG